MKKLDDIIFQNMLEKKKEKSIKIRNKEKIIKYKYDIIYLKYQYKPYLKILNYIITIIIILPISLSKNNLRKLIGTNQITIKINTKGLIQIFNSDFNELPSTIKVNSVTTNLQNRKLNLT